MPLHPFQTDDARLNPIKEKVLASERLTTEDALALYRTGDILAVGGTLALAETFHTEGFYKRESSLANPLLASEAAALDVGGLDVLAQIFRRPALLRADVVDVVAVVDVGDQPRAVLFHQRNTLVVDQDARPVALRLATAMEGRWRVLAPADSARLVKTAFSAMATT